MFNKFLVIVIIFLLPFSTTIAIAQPNTTQSDNNEFKCSNFCCCDSKNPSGDLLHDPTIIAAVITGAFGIIGGIGIEQVIVDRIKKRNLYFVPYTKWCISFSSALREFEEICVNIIEEFKGNQKTANSPTDVISHIWSMHKEVEDGYKWLSIIEKTDETKAKTLNEIMDVVDRLWHRLEYDYIDYILGKSTPKNIKEILIELNTYKKLENVELDIRWYILNAHYTKNYLFESDNFKHIDDVLKENVPLTYKRGLQNWLLRRLIIKRLKNNPQ